MYGGNSVISSIRRNGRRATMRGKTMKTLVLPGFCKIERSVGGSSGSGGMLPVMWPPLLGSWLPKNYCGDPVAYECLWKSLYSFASNLAKVWLLTPTLQWRYLKMKIMLTSQSNFLLEFKLLVELPTSPQRMWQLITPRKCHLDPGRSTAT